LDFRVDLLTRRERRALMVTLAAVGLIVVVALGYSRPVLSPTTGPTEAMALPTHPIHTTVDIGGGRTVVIVTRVRAPGFVGPIVIDQDHWIAVQPSR
jgi:hypothetical protein